MGTIKVSILEKDGVEYGIGTEMDLNAALDYVGASTPVIQEYSLDPVSPVNGEMWVKKTDIATPIGLLLTLTRADSMFQLSYKTFSDGIKRCNLE